MRAEGTLAFGDFFVAGHSVSGRYRSFLGKRQGEGFIGDEERAYCAGSGEGLQVSFVRYHKRTNRGKDKREGKR